MEIVSKESGSMIKLTEEGHMSMSIEPNILVTGRKTNNTAME